MLKSPIIYKLVCLKLLVSQEFRQNILGTVAENFAVHNNTKNGSYKMQVTGHRSQVQDKLQVTVL